MKRPRLPGAVFLCFLIFLIDLPDGRNDLSGIELNGDRWKPFEERGLLFVSGTGPVQMPVSPTDVRTGSAPFAPGKERH